MKTYVCRKSKLYKFLTEKGFVPYDVCPDKWDCKKKQYGYTMIVKKLEKQ